MPTFQFNPQLFPDNPGVYLMKDGQGKIVYVGKAKSLRKRLSQYFQGLDSREKVKYLVETVQDIETIPTNTEPDALLLENELIKLHQPQFNTLLKDDKSFPFIMITCEDFYPRVQIIRGVEQYSPKNLFFGPYTDKGSVVQILKAIRPIFPYCSHTSPLPDKKCRPCLYYHMNQCPAPCRFPGDEEFQATYRSTIKNLVLFIRGNYSEIKARLQAEMDEQSVAQNYERAAVVRDRLVALGKMFRPQSVINVDYGNMDVITQAKNDDEMLVMVLEVRDGRLIGKIPFIYDIKTTITPDEELLGNFLVSYYNKDKQFFPDQIVLNKPVDDLESVQTAIATNSKGQIKATILAGKDSSYASLLDIGRKNAFYLLHKRKLNRDLATFDHQDALKDLAGVLNLDRIPVVVEGYDISNIQGKFATASKVCFKDGKPLKSGYRHFRIKSGDTPDDFRMMNEVISRRFAKVANGEEDPPDLVIIDGGRGQLNTALDAIHSLSLDIPMIGLAKREEEIYSPDLDEPISLPKDTKALQFLQSVRDESHRFALKYHHQVKAREVDELVNALGEIEGIGKTRADMLRVAFKTLDAVKDAELNELEAVLRSKKVAKAVHEHFHGTEET